MRCRIGPVGCTLLLLAGAARAAPSIVVFEVPTSGALGADEASFVNQLVRSEAQGAARSRGASLLPSARLPAGCDGGSCAAQAARQKGASFAVSGAVSARGAGTALVLRLFSAEGAALAQQEATSPSGIDGLPDSIPAAVRSLLGSLPSGSAASSAPAPSAAGSGPAASAARPSAPDESTQTRAQSTSHAAARVGFWAGVGAIGAGLAFDAFSPTSRDHKLGGADFVPVGLYVLGAVALVYSVTR